MNEATEHIFPTMGRNVEHYECPVLTGSAREEIIRCPNCKSSFFEDEMFGDKAYCDKFHGWYACEGGFCHLAKRKENLNEQQ